MHTREYVIIRALVIRNLNRIKINHGDYVRRLVDIRRFPLSHKHNPTLH